MKNKKITPKKLPQPRKKIDPKLATLCPRCGNPMQEPFVALCRRDNKTTICPDCGTNQALQDILTPKLNKNQKPETLDNFDLPRENQIISDNQKLATVLVAPKNPKTHISIPTYNADGTVRTRDEEYRHWMMFNLREHTNVKFMNWKIKNGPSVARQIWHDFVWALTGYNVPTKEFDFQRTHRRRQEEIDFLEAHGPIC